MAMILQIQPITGRPKVKNIPIQKIGQVALSPSCGTAVVYPTAIRHREAIVEPKEDTS